MRLTDVFLIVFGKQWRNTAQWSKTDQALDAHTILVRIPALLVWLCTLDFFPNKRNIDIDALRTCSSNVWLEWKIHIMRGKSTKNPTSLCPFVIFRAL